MFHPAALGFAAAIAGFSGCASGPTVMASGGAGASVTVDIKNDSGTRPGTVRLAAADYTIDGKPVLKLRTDSGGDVPDKASWTGALSPGEHVLEATLSYPPRAAAPGDDMEFRVHETYRFRSQRGGAVRIRIEEAVREAGLTTASLDSRLGVRIQQY
jgi:hypothetical protein